MTLELFAERVLARRNGGKQTFDPMTILAIITAVVEIGKMVRECYLDWNKKDIVAGYNAWGVMGWLRRRKVRAALVAAKLDDSYAEHIVAEMADMGTADFQRVVKYARYKGGY